MKKYLKLIILLFIIIFFNSIPSNASSSITYFYLDTFKIENNNIEILSDELLIDTTNSNIENTILLKNTSESEIETELVFPLENTELGISIKNLSIKLNDTSVDYKKNDNGEYIVKTKISPNSGKQVYLNYETDNDLQNAKVIKCNFDNFAEKKIDKLKVDVKIDDKNIPFVKNIYPAHYTFDNNVISIEYYNYEVNTITKDVIVKKETLDSLLYGREVELSDLERNIINEWYLNDKVDLSNISIYDSINNFVARNIIDYQNIKNGTSFQYYSLPSEPLLYYMDYDVEDIYKDKSLKGKKVCIDYVETEGNAELYISKTVDVQDTEYGVNVVEDLFKVSEMEILKTKGSLTSSVGNLGAQIIFVGCGVDQENLNATEEEKISYINQIDADIYIRIEIYDGKIQYKVDDYGEQRRIGKGMVGYYDNNNSEIVKAFTLCSDDELKTEQQYYDGYQYDYNLFYSNYEDYSKNYYNDYYNNSIIKLSNDYISSNCEIPTVVQFIGNRVSKDGKYVVDFFNYSGGFYDGSNRGLITTKAVLDTSQAQNMLTANRQKNANIKAEVENKIANIEIIDDESVIQKEIEDSQKTPNPQTDNKQVNKNEQSYTIKLETRDIIIFSIIGLGIFICLIILIIEFRKRRITYEEKRINKN